MAFNAGAFIGGFSQAVSARIQESNKEAARIREEERLEQRTIDREARASQREEEKLKRDRERNLTELTQSLALHYDKEQMTSILKSGKAGAEYALEQANAYRAEDLDPRTMYNLKDFEIERAEVAPVATSLRTEAEAGPAVKQGDAIPFASRFKILPTKVRSKAKTFEARLVELSDRMANAEDVDSKERYKEQYANVTEQYVAFKKENKVPDDLSIPDRNSLLKNTLNRKLSGVPSVSFGLDGTPTYVDGDALQVARAHQVAYEELMELNDVAEWKNNKEMLVQIQGIGETAREIFGTKINPALADYRVALAGARNEALTKELERTGVEGYVPLKSYPVRDEDGNETLFYVDPSYIDANVNSYRDGDVISYVYNDRPYHAIRVGQEIIYGHTFYKK
jgi:hypothetical protein